MIKKIECTLRRKQHYLIQTNRLFLREFTDEDFDALFEILSDSEVMKYYPKPFDADRVKGWIKWNQENYKNYGFGLWALCLKDSGKLIGDCGIQFRILMENFCQKLGIIFIRIFGSRVLRRKLRWLLEIGLLKTQNMIVFIRT